MVEVVTYEQRGSVAWLTLNRPEKRNALDRQLRDSLFDALERAAADPGVRVVVLTGAGDSAFCAGYDLDEMSREGLEVPSADAIPDLGRNVEFHKPLIGCLNGDALGAGFLLLQNCDLVVAVDTARLFLPEARIGRGAPWAVPSLRMLPPRIMMELLLTGNALSVGRAHELGLVNEVTTADRLVDRTQILAETVAANAPLSVRAGRQMVRSMLASAQEYESVDELWRPVYLSPDAQEGPAAHLAGRSPRWVGDALGASGVESGATHRGVGPT